jgi:hypothetical protein
MAVGFPPTVEEKRSYRDEDVDWERVIERALDELGWSFGVHDDGTYFDAHTPFSFWSYGEQVIVEVDPDRGRVRVISRCSWPLQWIDWGKNQRNVDRFFEELERQLDRAQRRRRRPD